MSVFRYVRCAAIAVVCGLLALTPLPSLATQALETQSEGVTLLYGLPEHVTLHEPVSLEIAATNSSAENVTIDFGKNKVGSTQIAVTAPGGSRLAIDPRRPLRADEAWVSGVVTLRPQQTVRAELILNEWMGIDAVGLYHFAVQFIGKVGSSNDDIERRFSFTLEVRPRSASRLREVADRLVRQIQSPYAESAILAAKKLSYLDDPVAVPFLSKVIDERRGTWVDPIMINALERIGSDDALAALLKARTSDDSFTAGAAAAAIDRLDSRRGPAGR